MKQLGLILTLSFILNSISYSQSQVKIIFDTDIGGDADDLGAVAMLHNFVNKGECELLAIMSWSTNKYAVPAIDALNRYYGNPDIPIGVRKDEIFESKENYNRIIAENFPYQLNNNDVPDATKLYRKILASQKDRSVSVVTVGPLANIKRLLESKADEISPLNGSELICKKVKEFIIMGGKFPSGENEWNFNGGMPGVTKYVVENLQVPTVFSGFELGVQIKTAAVFNEIDKNTPLYKGFLYFSEHAPWMKERFQGKILDNASYDQTAVLYAVRGGVGEYWEPICGGYVEVDQKGDNRWIKGKVTNHSYLKLTEDPEKMASLIEAIMLDKF